MPEEAPLRAASASFFKNCVVRGWDSGGDEGKPAVRAALLEALCCATESAVLRVLADAFRWVAQADFARHAKGADGAMEGTAPPAPRWASLVAELQRALKASNLMPGADGALQSASPVLTLNVLVAVHTLLKPYQFFLDPSNAREKAPASMEAVVSQLFAPLLDIFKSVAVQHAAGVEAATPTLHVLLKALHHCVKAYMPVTLRPRVGEWAEVARGVVATVPAALARGAEDCRAHKRAVQVLLALVTRHQAAFSAAQLQSFAEAGFEAAKAVATAAAGADEALPGKWEVCGAYCFDLLARLLETTSGWNLLQAHLGAIVASAALPALAMRPADAALWTEDGEEFMRRCLPCDSETSSGLGEDHYTLRLAALNLMGFIGKARGPPPGARTRAISKRKKGKLRSVSAPTGASVIVPLLAGTAFAHPAPLVEACTPTASGSQQCAALLAWGSLKDHLIAVHNASEEGQHKAEQEALDILTRRALPAMALGDPFVAAHGAWLAGELAGLLPEDKAGVVYEGLTALLAAEDLTIQGGRGGNEEELSLTPLRSAAANSLIGLLENGTLPVQWAALVDAVMGLARSQDEEEACRALAIVEAAATADASAVAQYAGALGAALGQVAVAWLDLYTESDAAAVTSPWPPAVEASLSALAALADAYDEAVKEAGGEEEEDEEEEEEEEEEEDDAEEEDGSDDDDDDDDDEEEEEEEEEAATAAARDALETEREDAAAAALGALEEGRAALSTPLAQLLHRFWLHPAWRTGGADGQVAVPPSCMREGCVLMGCILKSVRRAGGATAAAVAAWRVEELSAVLSAGLGDFEPWSEECVPDVLVSLDQLLEMQEEAPMVSFAAAAIAQPLCRLFASGIRGAPAESAVQLARRAHQLLARLAGTGGGGVVDAVANELAAATGERLGGVAPDSAFARPLAVMLASCVARAPVSAAYAAAAAGCSVAELAAAAAAAVEGELVDEAAEARILALGCARVVSSNPGQGAQALGALAGAALDAARLVGELDGDGDEEDGEEEEEMDEVEEEDDEEESDDSDEEEEEEEETEEEFLARYAAEAKRMQEEAEGGNDEWDPDDEEEGHADEGELGAADVGVEVAAAVRAALAAGAAPEALRERAAAAGEHWPAIASLSQE